MKRANEELYEPQDLETEGERQLRALLQNQLDTRASLESCVSRRARFSPGSLYEPLASRSAGALSLSQFRDLQNKESERDALRDLGLSDSDIQLWKNPESASGKADPHAVLARRAALELKVAERERILNLPPFAGKKLNRREMEIERAMFQGTDRQHYLTALYHEGDSSTTARGLEAENLELTKGCRGKDDVRSAQTLHCVDTIAQNPHKAGAAEENEEQTLHCVDSVKMCPAPSVPVMEKICPTVLPAGCTLGSLGSGGAAGAVREFVQSVSEEEIQQNRVSLEEILSLDKYRKYHSGEPSRVLRISNLSSDVSLRDLVALFSRFQPLRTFPSPPQTSASSFSCPASTPDTTFSPSSVSASFPNTISSISHAPPSLSHTPSSTSHPPPCPPSLIQYRVLTGRLSGQAFITLPDVQIATSALQLLLGYRLHGQPMIIEYARKSSGMQREPSTPKP
ncbi:LOW QUALITY PROTEIN: RNA-binding protein 41 [Discoglossus pictus]